MFIVSSKSGSTLEPNIFKQYFFERTTANRWCRQSRQPFHRHHRSRLEDGAGRQSRNFRHIFYGLPSIGGRYSALSNFGMVPAAAMGLDAHEISRSHASKWWKPASHPRRSTKIPAYCSARFLGRPPKGRDKVTHRHFARNFRSRRMARATARRIDGQTRPRHHPRGSRSLGAPSVYGNDRVFAYLRLEAASDATQDAKVAALEKAGQPVIRIAVADIYNLGQEFFRWEIATAVAGSIIGINAFNQPDVEASKIVTRDLTSAYEKTGSLPAETPVLEDSGIKLFTDPKNAEALAKAAGNDRHARRLPSRSSQSHRRRRLFCFARLHPDECRARSKLQEIRHAVRDKKRVATCLGFGPRFLHSTGQAYKGGPNSGVFLQITCDDAVDLPVPGPEIHFRHRKSGPGSRRFPGAGGAWPPGLARPSRQRSSSPGLSKLAKLVSSEALELRFLRFSASSLTPYTNDLRLRSRICGLAW